MSFPRRNFNESGVASWAYLSGKRNNRCNMTGAINFYISY